MQMLPLAEALQFMERKNKRGLRIPFDVTFCTAHRDEWRKIKDDFKRIAAMPDGPEKSKLMEVLRLKDIGGDLITLEKAVLSGLAPIKAMSSGKVVERPSSKRAPRHFINKTRNFRLFNGLIRKAHIKLITQLNGMEVLY